ncbi:MAG: hydantoinase/oxoprolinase family protein [Ectothiorhodospiraceae bacterium]|nr:hydantoinase/oxoprolinase family protein [Chromatiales bacterium]MCP5157093.1 hydantoinase/oxoprolinase family protein [Ectothiorhodospiraceae bacterium]
MTQARLAVDIGGTFTDVALEVAGAVHTGKVLTTPRAPEEAVMRGVAEVLERAAIAPADVGLVIHGTTLATNTIIERKGARTALITTEGFRDSVEMGYEHRFEQYDIYMDKPRPLVPRYLRLPVRERVSAGGAVLVPLDEASVRALVPALREAGIESVAVGLIHAYANSEHERRVAEILRDAMPDLWVTLSSEVCPEIREYERMSTACANAYVQPLMASYLAHLQTALDARGFACPLYLMMSGGGLTTVETAARFPIRLVESGPAGGAILASHIAEACGLDEVLSYDMGGTTAKICLIDDGRPQTSRTFEVDRQYRFTKGSGLPVRIPVIEMVEIGAGGGSIARVDAMRRVQVGPDSAGSEPGPACYDRGGESPTVTDADVVLGKIAPEGFAGGSVALAPARAERALAAEIGTPLALTGALAAFAVSELVDDNMANAARVHAVEQGKDLGSRALVAFGGAAPLHACRIAEKLGIERVLVPTGAGVGSAIGFLRAPVAYEVVRSRYVRMREFDAGLVNTMFDEMAAEAREIVTRGAPGAALEERRIAYMRYVGQGHEIVVEVPTRTLTADDAGTLSDAFDAAYRALFGRTIPSMQVEVLTWALTVSTPPAAVPPMAAAAPREAPPPSGTRRVFDAEQVDFVDVAVHRRDALAPGMRVPGPCLVVEDQTTTIVSARFDLVVNGLGYLELVRRTNPGAAS